MFCNFIHLNPKAVRKDHFMHFILPGDFKKYYFSVISLLTPNCSTDQIVIQKYEVKYVFHKLEVPRKSTSISLNTYFIKCLKLKVSGN